MSATLSYIGLLLLVLCMLGGFKCLTSPLVSSLGFFNGYIKHILETCREERWSPKPFLSVFFLRDHHHIYYNYLYEIKWCIIMYTIKGAQWQCLHKMNVKNFTACIELQWSRAYQAVRLVKHPAAPFILILCTSNKLYAGTWQNIDT